MRLARFLGGDARSWLNLQIAYDLRVTEKAHAKDIERAVEPLRRSAYSLRSRPIGHPQNVKRFRTVP